jgi:hypothetical protein
MGFQEETISDSVFYFVRLTSRLRNCSTQNIWALTRDVAWYDLDIRTVGGRAATCTALIKGYTPTWRSMSSVLLQSMPLAPSVQHFN